MFCVFGVADNGENTGTRRQVHSQVCDTGTGTATGIISAARDVGPHARAPQHFAVGRPP